MTDHGPKIAEVGFLIGDPARATMLAALLDGRALTASELACTAGVAPQTASGHLARLRDAELLAVTPQGRHRYYRLATKEVAQLLEAIMVAAQATPARQRPHWRGGDALRHARTCYDHLAGRLAVDLADALVAQGHVVLTDDGGHLTDDGHVFLRSAGIAIAAPSTRRAVCRPCMDWSERRPHLAGAVGAALLAHALERGWVRRTSGSRALDLTAAGRAGFARSFGLTPDG